MLYHGTFIGGMAYLRPANQPAQPVQATAQSTAKMQASTVPLSTVKTVIAVPRDKWPLAVQAFAKLAKPTDRGIGDVIARVIGPIGGTAFKATMASLGINCGCDQRQDTLNAKWPFGLIETLLQDPLKTGIFTHPDGRSV